MDQDVLIEQAMMVVRRLERLSADSIWSHLSCGYRGALLRAVDEREQGQASTPDTARLEWLIQQGFTLLANAARELVIPDEEC